MKLKKLLFVIALTLPILTASLPASAATNYANLMSDGTFDNYGTMSVSQIDNFLNGFPSSCISSHNGFRAPDPVGYNPTNGYIYGGDVTAGKVIYDIAQAYEVNPQVLLATTQKEESLVTGGSGICTTLRYSAAMGYGCPDGGHLYNYNGVNMYTLNGHTYTSISGTCVNSKQKVGFSQQMVHAAWLLKFDRMRAEGKVTWAIIKGSWDNSDDLETCYTGYMTAGNYKVCPSGQTTLYDGIISIDGSSLHIANGVTAALYDYTPHKSGNDHFDTIFTQWFGSVQTSVPYDWTINTKAAYADAGHTQKFSDSNVVHLNPGQKAYLQVTALNTGYQTWSNASMHLATSNPDDRTSSFYDPSWLSANRPAAMNEASVAPDAIGTFNFAVTAPATPGNYNEYFSLVAEHIKWLNDPGLNFMIDVNAPILAQTTNNRLNSGDTLTTDPLVSQDKKSELILSGGTLTLMNDFSPVWSKTGTGGASKLVMQGDGNLVLRNASNTALWSSGTSGNAGAYLVVSTNGNLIVYNSSNSSIWTSNTLRVPDGLSYVNSRVFPGDVILGGQQLDSASEASHLFMQTDGNLVLRGHNNAAIWSSGTAGNPGAFLVFQSDGNLVIRGSNGRTIWDTNTSGEGGWQFILQPSGNMVIYGGGNKAIWNANTVQPNLAANNTNSKDSVSTLIAGQSISNNGYILMMQSDGNLVERDSHGKAIWNSRTGGSTNATLTVQSDGNVVIRKSNGRPIWTSGTPGIGSSTLMVQRNGSIALYTLRGHLKWQAN